MPIDYKTFMKHAAKVTTGEHIATRPTLQGVYHKADGTLYATDSHRLYIAKNVAHGKEDGSLLSPKGEKVDGQYPAVDRILPTDKPKHSLEVDVKEWLQAVDLLYTVGRITTKEKVIIRFEGDKVALYQPGQVSGFYTLPITFEERIGFNALYILEALKLFKDYGSPVITLNLYGALRPATFIDEDLTALVLPVRTMG